LIRAGLLLLALGALLALPLFRSREDRPLTVFVLDTSASSVAGLEVWDNAPDAAIDALSKWMRGAVESELRAAPWSEGDAEVLTFAESTRLAFGRLSAGKTSRAVRFARAEELVPELGMASDLDGALQRAEESLRGQTRARLVLLGDGSYSGADPAPRLQAMAERGVSIERLSPPRHLPDLALSRLDLAARIPLGSRAVAHVEVALAPADTGAQDAAPLACDLVLKLTGPSGKTQTLRPWSEPRFLGPAPERLVSELDLGVLAEGAWQLDVSLDWRDGFPLNDRRVASFMVGSLKRVLVACSAANEPSARAFLGAKLPGLALSFVRPGELEARLGRADLLVSWDLPLSSLPAARLISEVRAGLGWLTLGAWGQFSDPAGADPELEALLPLLTDDEETPPRRVILCVDGSGSMSGAPFDAVRRAAFELVRAAPAKDDVSLAFFTNDLGAEWHIRPALEGPLAPRTVASQDRAGKEMAELMAAEVPGGDTRILDALAQLASRRRASASVPALVILLSDGAENGMDVNDPYALEESFDRARELGRQFREADTTMAVVSINVAERTPAQAAAARGLLAALVPPGGQLHEVGVEAGAGELTDVFAREVAARLVAVGDFRLSQAKGTLATELGGVAEHLNTVGRFRLAPGARLLASAVGTDVSGADLELPALAVQELRGLGRVGLLATAPSSSWAPTWTQNGSLLPLLRWLAADREDRALTARRAEDWLVLEGTAELFDEGVVPAAIQAVLRSGERRARLELSLAPTAGGSATYRGRLPLGWSGAPGLEVGLLDPSVAAWDEVLATLGVPLEAQMGEGAPDRPRLGSLPQAGFGAAGVSSRRLPHRAARWVLGLALLVLFAGLLKRS